MMATRDDVARLANVSGASVARAFNDPSKLSQDTYDRIMSAAQALNYHPNYFGRALKSKNTRQIYAYCPELSNPFFVHVYFGMEQYAMEHDYQIYLSRAFNRNMIYQGRYDGFLFPVYNAVGSMDDIHFLRDNRFPVVTTNFHSLELQDIPCVGVDVEAAGYTAMDYLRKLGHKSIAFATDVIDPKWMGVQKCCRQYGVQHVPLVLSLKDSHKNFFECGKQLACRVSEMKNAPTAILAVNDEMSVGLISALVKLGYKIPEDISVMGFDDTEIASYAIPPLTTVRYPKYEIGYEMARMLHQIMKGQPYESRVLQTQLVVRESTAPPQARA